MAGDGICGIPVYLIETVGDFASFLLLVAPR